MLEGNGSPVFLADYPPQAGPTRAPGAHVVNIAVSATTIGTPSVWFPTINAGMVFRVFHRSEHLQNVRLVVDAVGGVPQGLQTGSLTWGMIRLIGIPTFSLPVMEGPSVAFDLRMLSRKTS